MPTPEPPFIAVLLRFQQEVRPSGEYASVPGAIDQMLAAYRAQAGQLDISRRNAAALAESLLATTDEAEKTEARLAAIREAAAKLPSIEVLESLLDFDLQGRYFVGLDHLLALQRAVEGEG